MVENNIGKFGGRVLFLNRSNINTDEIIPAKYLVYIDKEPLIPHLLEDLKLEEFNPATNDWSQFQAVVSRKNFGSGSSRENAVWVFDLNGIRTLIASNFARIFRENAFNNGILAIELGEEQTDVIFTRFAGNPKVNVQVDLEGSELIFTADKIPNELRINFSINPFERDLILAGGWVNLADQKY